MSRKTDSSSSGPQGRGGAGYPSGTPPYGSGQYPSPLPQQDAPEETDIAPAPQPDEPRTETTLTTRIRINIPGSRPIPPVVMRTPMGEGTEGRGIPAGEHTGATPRPEPAPAEAREPEAEKGNPPAEKPTSDWFAPRKGPAAGTAGTGTADTPPMAGGTPGMGAGAAAAAGPAGPPPPPPGGERRAPEPPYPSDVRQPPPHGAGDPSGQTANVFGGGGRNTPPTHPGGRAGGGAAGPDGPTTGPVTGDSALGALSASLGNAPRAGGPGGGQRMYDAAGGPGGTPRMSDDTAVLTPQPQAPEPGPAGHLSGATLTSGVPVVPAGSRSPFPGSAPRVGGGPGPAAAPGFDQPPSRGQNQGFSPPDFLGTAPATQVTPPSGPAPAHTTTAAAPPAPAKKGRSKLVLAVVALVVVAGGFYGAGLLMNHSDVPKGSTVLGVDIGGGTRDQAVQKLDAALANRASAPLKLLVGGKAVELSPDKAGLSLDSQATVRAAAVSDYNPVSVISSLLGGARVVDPVIPVDEEKLTAALTDLAGRSGSATDGTITFDTGKAVAVPGKAGKTLDVSHSIISVRDAYRAQVQTGRTNNVELPAVTRQPTVSQAELDRAMKDFAEPAMSDLITIKAAGKEIQFGPARSLPKILSMKAVNGRLIEVYNKKAIDKLLDGVFDGITITKGDGQQHPVSADDVAHAMQTALLGKTTAERTQVIDLDAD